MKTKNGETIIPLPNSNRFIALEPTLETILQKPQGFNISLIDPAENEPLGTYKFKPPTKKTNTIKYELAKLTSYKQNSNVPRTLINTSTKILQEIAKKQKQKFPSHKVIHNCNLYLMRSNATAKNSVKDLEKANKIINIYKDNKYTIKNATQATRTY